jgi:hypothetical protein
VGPIFEPRTKSSKLARNSKTRGHSCYRTLQYRKGLAVRGPLVQLWRRLVVALPLWGSGRGCEAKPFLCVIERERRGKAATAKLALRY